MRLRGLRSGTSRHQIGAFPHRAVDQHIEAVGDAQRGSRVGRQRDVVGDVRRQAHRQRQRAPCGLERALGGLEGQLGLGARRLRLQHVGDGGEPDAMALLRRLEVGLRLLQCGLLGGEQRLGGVVLEVRRLDVQHDVLNHRIVGPIGGKQRLPRPGNRSRADAEVEHEP